MNMNLTKSDTRKARAEKLSSLEALLCDELEPLFARPDLLDKISAWFGHIPFAHWIIKVTRPRILVELGTHAGVSYSAFCAAVIKEKTQTRCYAVDTWAGDEHAGRYGSEIYDDLKNFNDERYSHFSTLLRCTFDEALDHFADNSIDVLHIDGYHTYEAVSHDFTSWQPKLSDRAVVLFHDTNEYRKDFGVWRFWAEMRERYPSFEFLHSHGLGVLAVGDHVPSAIVELCSLDDDEKVSAIRNRFQAFGSLWAIEAKAIKEKTDHLNQIKKIEEKMACEIERVKTDAAKRISDKDAEIERLKERVTWAENRALCLEQENKAILSSTSWRLTKPLRILAGHISHPVRGHLMRLFRITRLATSPMTWKLRFKQWRVYKVLSASAKSEDRRASAYPKRVDVTYSALRQEILQSGLWDERWYLSNYYEHYLASKKKRSRGDLFFPLDYYLQEGWKLGHEPSELLPVEIDQNQVECSKIEYFLHRLRFDGYQFYKNIWIPSPERISEYFTQKQSRRSKKVIYTCILQHYDVLMQPYFISDDWDYVCFTDDPDLIGQGNVGIWEIHPTSRVLSSEVRTNRWHKMHPHILFPTYEESIYIDGNINILSNYIFDQITKRDKNILLPQHFARNCIYQEIEILLQRSVISDEDKSLLMSQYQFLEEEGFPKGFGLSENNLIYRRHHNNEIINLMSDWWAMYEKYSPRDQASLAYVFWKHGLSLQTYMFANCRVNYRDFWVMTHNMVMPGANSGKTPSITPAFDRNNIAVVFSTNKQFIPYLGVAIFSLIEHISERYNYDVVILAKGLPESAFASILGLARDRTNVSIRIYDTTALTETLPTDIFHVEGYVPVETYNKCFLNEILSGYDRCVYLDSDIIVLDDIQKLHDIDLKGHSIGASVNVANVNAAFCKKVIKGRRFDEYLRQDLGVIDYNQYFQAGVVVLNMKKLRTMNLRNLTIQALKKIKKPIFFDQCVFNSIFYGDVCFFSTCWNHVWYIQQYSYLRGSVRDEVFFDYARGRVDPKIVHYAGKDKPQNTLGWALSDLFWKFAYASPFLEDIRKDILVGGTQVAQAISSAPNSGWYNIKPRLLVHVHLYYRDQLDVMMNAIRNISQCDFNLFVTIVEEDQNAKQQILKEWKDAQIMVLPNVGYDVYPFLHILKQVRLSNYDFILKIHTKNMRAPGQDEVYGIKVPGYQWRDELLNAIVGSKEIFERNLARFLEDRTLGCIGAEKFIFSTEENREETTYRLAEWRRRCGVEGGIHYVGGSMFLARAYPFERLKGLNMQAKDFESPHMGTKDYKNTAHIFERLFGIVVESEGFNITGA